MPGQLLDELPPGQPGGTGTDGLQRRHRTPVDGDHHLLASLHPLEKPAGVVAKLTGGHLGHATSVATVRRPPTGTIGTEGGADLLPPPVGRLKPRADQPLGVIATWTNGTPAWLATTRWSAPGDDITVPPTTETW